MSSSKTQRVTRMDVSAINGTTSFNHKHDDEYKIPPRRADGAPEICECDERTRTCSCRPWRPKFLDQQTTQRKDADTMADPVEVARRERDARVKTLANTNTVRADSAEERARIEVEIAHERRRQAFRDSLIAERLRIL